MTRMIFADQLLATADPKKRMHNTIWMVRDFDEAPIRVAYAWQVAGETCEQFSGLAPADLLAVLRREVVAP